MSSYFCEHDCSSGETPNNFMDLVRLLVLGSYWDEIGIRYSDLFDGKPPPPASKEVVADLKTSVVKEEKGLCSVCLKAYEEGVIIKHLPCSHDFHDTCILPWLQKTSTCPLCRFQLKTDDEVYESYQDRKRGEAERRAQLSTLHDSMFS